MVKKYIETKLIEAKKMTQGEFFAETGATSFIPQCEEWLKGYKIIHNNEVSWVPEFEFDQYNLELSINPNLKTNYPSISPEMVDSFIKDYDIQTQHGKITTVIATLVNGFTIVESSACVSPDNYDEKLGAEICKKKIKDKIWFLLGFLLQTSIYGINKKDS